MTRDKGAGHCVRPLCCGVGEEHRFWGPSGKVIMIMLNSPFGWKGQGIKMPKFPGIGRNLGILMPWVLWAAFSGARRAAARGAGSWRKGLPDGSLRVARSCGVVRPSPSGEKRQRALASFRMTGIFWCGTGGHGVRPCGMSEVVAGQGTTLRRGCGGPVVLGASHVVPYRRPEVRGRRRSSRTGGSVEEGEEGGEAEPLRVGFFAALRMTSVLEAGWRQ